MKDVLKFVSTRASDSKVCPLVTITGTWKDMLPFSPSTVSALTTTNKNTVALNCAGVAAVDVSKSQ